MAVCSNRVVRSDWYVHGNASYAIELMQTDFIVIVAICTFLALSHKRHRMKRYYEVMEYYRDQTR